MSTNKTEYLPDALVWCGGYGISALNRWLRARDLHHIFTVDARGNEVDYWATPYNYNVRYRSVIPYSDELEPYIGSEKLPDEIVEKYLKIKITKE